MVLSYATSGNARVEDLDLAWMLKRPGCLVLTFIAPKGIIHHMLEGDFALYKLNVFGNPNMMLFEAVIKSLFDVLNFYLRSTVNK